MQSTTHLEPSPAAVTSVSTGDLHSGPTTAEPAGLVQVDQNGPSKTPDEVAPRQPGVVPDPQVARQLANKTADDEGTLWETRPSIKTFVVRLFLGSAVTLVWIAIAIADWGFGYSNLTGLAILLGAALLIFWAFTGVKLFRAIQNHHYRLTTRRLFVRTGFFSRRLDQIELLRVKDVFVRQSLLGKWLGIGHVVVVSSEKTVPRALLYGIDRPQFVMDLIWLRTRAELDNKTSRVEHV